VELALAVPDTLVYVLLALMGALALDRVVGPVGRWLRLPRAGAVAVVVAAALAAVALVTSLLVPALVQQHRLVQPLVIGRAVRLSALTTLIAALIGGAVAGLIGTVLAVPLVAAAKAARAELRKENGP
jgi:predicted PurR-regulated permease PerM